MKPIEYCLDRILEELQKSWELKDRPPLDAASLLREFEVSQERHEFFKSLINKLIKDGNADFLDDVPSYRNASLETYKTRTMLTAEGYYLIAEYGGYRKKKKVDNRRHSIEYIIKWLLVFGAISLSIIELVDLSLKYHWFSCH